MTMTPVREATPQEFADIHRSVSCTGTHTLVRSLEALGTKCVFGPPDGSTPPIFDLTDSETMRYVPIRHEQDAGHAASGYAQASGNVGVCLATSASGATSLVTPIADAQQDSVPMVAITAFHDRPHGAGGTREGIDIIAVTMPITKHGFQVTDPSDIPRVLAEAFHLALTGRPGVVLVDISRDVLRPRLHLPSRSMRPRH